MFLSPSVASGKGCSRPRSPAYQGEMYVADIGGVLVFPLAATDDVARTRRLIIDLEINATGRVSPTRSFAGRTPVLPFEPFGVAVF